MTEPDRPYRGPLPGEVPLSRDSRPGGAMPGLTFDDVTGRVVRTDEGDASSSDPAPDPASSVTRPAHVPDRGRTRAQRRTDGLAMVPLLARALSSQLAQLVADDDGVPDGWWFTPDR